ncbi:MAG: TIGR02757 family protein [Treponema sp.]|nr:TIGR02757 family protein [Treponema sp.]
MAIVQISAAVKKQMRLLADKYETCNFSNGDPSCILQKYHAVADKEVAAFIVALLSFGRRDLFMKKADVLFTLARNHPAAWIKNGKWINDFPHGSKKFYRFYSYDDMRAVFAVLQTILAKEKTFGAYVRKTYMSRTARNAKSVDKSDCRENMPHLSEIISCIFRGCRAVPQSAASANKRIHMFLRWMVRIDSPVDAGLWTWYSPAELIIPLDVHVLRQAIKLKLVPPKSSASAKTAWQLTAVLKQIWPNDPCRGDFALFGLGIDAGVP